MKETGLSRFGHRARATWHSTGSRFSFSASAVGALFLMEERR